MEVNWPLVSMVAKMAFRGLLSTFYTKHEHNCVLSYKEK